MSEVTQCTKDSPTSSKDVFWMVNNIFMLLFYESMKLHIVYQDFIYSSVYIISEHQYKLLCLLQLIFDTLGAL